MTQWQEFPLRPQGRPWVGINTRSGKLDDGSGQMTDASVNCIINRADKLEKRKGLIRGLDERFAGSVCGLHKYTDECGREWLLVADEGGISIRQPFAIPSFAATDAYPSDSFQADGPVNSSTWTNVGNYGQSGGALVLNAGVLDGGDMRWFKDATNFSYELAGGWELNPDSTVVFIIKQGAVARLEALIADIGEVFTAQLLWTDAAGVEFDMGTAGLPIGTETGNVTISYSRDAANGVFAAQLLVQPTDGEALQIQDFTSINAVDDADFGQGTSVRIESTTGISASTITGVQGAPL